MGHSKIVIQYSQDPNDKDVLWFYGACKEAFESKLDHIVLCGPSDCGKTMALLTKMHLFCTTYPGAKVLWCRQKYEDLKKNSVPSFEKVLGMTNSQKIVDKIGGSTPTQFKYKYSTNTVDGVVYRGCSEIILSNMEKSNLLGAEYDMAYISQPDDSGLTEEVYRLAASRANGRRGYTPYAQVIADPNPSYEGHFLQKGAEAGDWIMLNAVHKDNPTLYDHIKNEWTAEGLRRLENMRKTYTAEQFERLFLGKWIETAGMAFPIPTVWDPDTQILSKDETYIDVNWPHYLAVDFGFTSPYVAALWAKTPEGRYVRHRLIYRTSHNIVDNSLLTKLMVSDVNLKNIIVDHNDGSGLDILEKTLQRKAVKANKRHGSVEGGLSIMSSYLQQRKLFFIKSDPSNALFHELDQNLLDKSKPTGFEEEAPALKKDPKKPGNLIKKDDHEADVTRYLCSFLESGHEDKIKLFMV